MRKIADTAELTGELQRLLDYANCYQPSRERLANELRELSQRVAGNKPLTPPKRQLVEQQLAEYGYTLSPTDEIQKNGKPLRVTITSKGPRLYALKPDGGKLWSGANVGDFVAAFWYAKKVANTTELTSELGRILDYAASVRPSRVKYDRRTAAAVPTDYAEAKKKSDELDAEADRAGKALKALSGGGQMGMTPDHVKASPEWKAAKRDYEKANAALRDFNSTYTKRFKKEIAEDRQKRRGK